MEARFTKGPLPSGRVDELFALLRRRFQNNTARHKDVDWTEVQSKLETSANMLWSLDKMEETGGEPDVIGRDRNSGKLLYVDCSKESPSGRRNICYDREALDARKEFKPKDSAVDIATAMGIQLLSPDQYRDLQQLGNFDTKTSSWVKTPENIRRLGGALFCDRRYDTVFVYHNGAPSYYASRGFRGIIEV